MPWWNPVTRSQMNAAIAAAIKIENADLAALAARITVLEADVTELQAQVAALELLIS